MALEVRKGLGDVKVPTIPWHKLSKLTRTHKILITVAIFGALWGCFVWFFYIPQTETIERLNKDLKSAQDKLARLKDVEKNLRAFKKQFKETEEKFKQALKLLPDKEEIPTLLTSISNLGAQSGLEFILFQPQKEVPRNFYAEIPLKIEVTGPYHNVATFFDQVSRLSRIVNIGDVTMAEMKAAKTQADSVILKTGCTATTYKFIEVKEEPKRGKKGRKRK
ncbi:MAG: type 4a pilus biogenesis protein PilO [Deltaproteobacteria bacterium]|nr:type 4a pilus biogenesis protein PilO [Deltaproteobacteria bacterium]